MANMIQLVLRGRKKEGKTKREGKKEKKEGREKKEKMEGTVNSVTLPLEGWSAGIGREKI